MSLTTLSSLSTSTEAFERNFRERWSIQICDAGTQITEMSPSPVVVQSISSKEALVKFLCHFYVTHMPIRGLAELSETLRSMTEFYKELPPQDQERSAERQVIRAKVTATMVRPAFHLDPTK